MMMMKKKKKIASCWTHIRPCEGGNIVAASRTASKACRSIVQLEPQSHSLSLLRFLLISLFSFFLSFHLLTLALKHPAVSPSGACPPTFSAGCVVLFAGGEEMT